MVTAETVTVPKVKLIVELRDGWSLSVPLAWFPRLVYATPAERKSWRLIGRGRGIHWNKLDEDISVEGLLAANRPGKARPRLRNGYPLADPVEHEVLFDVRRMAAINCLRSLKTR